LDFGRDGYAETLQVLEQTGIDTVGAGMNLQQATRPAMVEQNGLRLAFLAYCGEHQPFSPG
jgi:poly-gamma-glutamate synthesis protein (capsule biosynthesis protein)